MPEEWPRASVSQPLAETECGVGADQCAGVAAVWTPSAFARTAASIPGGGVARSLARTPSKKNASRDRKKKLSGYLYTQIYAHHPVLNNLNKPRMCEEEEEERKEEK